MVIGWRLLSIELFSIISLYRGLYHELQHYELSGHYLRTWAMSWKILNN